MPHGELLPSKCQDKIKVTFNCTLVLLLSLHPFLHHPESGIVTRTDIMMLLLFDLSCYCLLELRRM